MGAPDGELAKAIDRDFGSFDAMKEKLSASTVAVQVKRTAVNTVSTKLNSLTVAGCRSANPLG